MKYRHLSEHGWYLNISNDPTSPGFCLPAPTNGHAVNALGLADPCVGMQYVIETVCRRARARRLSGRLPTYCGLGLVDFFISKVRWIEIHE